MGGYARICEDMGRYVGIREDMRGYGTICGDTGGYATPAFCAKKRAENCKTLRKLNYFKRIKSPHAVIVYNKA